MYRKNLTKNPAKHTKNHVKKILKTYAAETFKTHTIGNHAAETLGANNTKNNSLDNGKMIENAAYFYAKNNSNDFFM